jgi:hypothetical protein
MGSVERSAGEEVGGGDSEEIYIEVTPSERAAVRTIQSMGHANPRINWEATARHLQISVSYLRALAKIDLPEHTNLIRMSSLNLDLDEHLSE